MKTVHLFRQYYESHTFGVLVTEDGQIFRTIERPWLDNKQNVSCIPRGKYKVTFLPRSASGKYRNVWLLHDVEKRYGILIHNGNLVNHTRGCLILGMSRGTLGNQPAVLNSRKALREFNEYMGQESFNLHIW